MVVVTEARPPYRIVHVNAAWIRTSGFSAEEAIGQTCAILQGPATCPEALRRLAEGVRMGTTLTVQLLNYTRDRRPFMNTLCIAPLQPPTLPGARPVASWHYVGVSKPKFIDPSTITNVAVAREATGHLAAGQVAPGGEHVSSPSPAEDVKHSAAKARVAPFISKLFKMVSTPETDAVIRWTEDGRSFIIFGARGRRGTCPNARLTARGRPPPGRGRLWAF